MKHRIRGIHFQKSFRAAHRAALKDAQELRELRPRDEAEKKARRQKDDDEMADSYCITNRGACFFQTKYQNCLDAGAVAGVVINSIDIYTTMPVNQIDPDFPFMFMTSSDGETGPGVPAFGRSRRQDDWPGVTRRRRGRRAEQT